jgi:hypothetical protein
LKHPQNIDAPLRIAAQRKIPALLHLLELHYFPITLCSHTNASLSLLRELHAQLLPVPDRQAKFPKISEHAGCVGARSGWHGSVCSERCRAFPHDSTSV